MWEDPTTKNYVGRPSALATHAAGMRARVQYPGREQQQPNMAASSVQRNKEAKECDERALGIQPEPVQLNDKCKQGEHRQGSRHGLVATVIWSKKATSGAGALDGDTQGLIALGSMQHIGNLMWTIWTRPGTCHYTTTGWILHSSCSSDALPAPFGSGPGL